MLFNKNSALVTIELCSLFLGMINPVEFRLGNYLMQKQQHRILTLPCSLLHFELMATGGMSDLYPVILKAEWLEKSGFVENKEYALLPSAREFRLVVPINGSQENVIAAYIKSNGECFARAMVQGFPSSNPVYHLHQLQNLYYAVTGEELVIKK